jgi:Ca2+-binding RTX toxin-like protein
MARLDVYEPLYMQNQSTWIGEIIAATPTVIAISDGFRQGDYYGNFKYKNGDIASGTVTNYNYFEGYAIQYSATGLKLNAKTVQNLVNSGNADGLMALALNGNDIIDASSLGDTSPGEVENTLWGFNGNDKIYGSAGIDDISGGNGNDLINGDEGDDILSGDNGNDVINGGNGVDILFGGDGNDKIYGGEGDDSLFGNNGNDVINGGNGDDLIFGELGKDTLTGGPGLNSFFFDTKLGSSNVDKITDFVSGDDTLFLDVSIFTNLPESLNLGDLADNLVIGTKALDSNDYLIFNPKTHSLSYDADASGAGKAVDFVILTGVNTISADDIWV